MITASQAHDIVTATDAIRTLRNQLAMINDPARIRKIDVTMSYNDALPGAQYPNVKAMTFTSADLTDQFARNIHGYFAKRVERLIAKHERTLRQLGAEIPE